MGDSNQSLSDDLASDVITGLRQGVSFDEEYLRRFANWADDRDTAARDAQPVDPAHVIRLMAIYTVLTDSECAAWQLELAGMTADDVRHSLAFLARMEIAKAVETVRRIVAMRRVA